jgi:hypothetical protein
LFVFLLFASPVAKVISPSKCRFSTLARKLSDLTAGEAALGFDGNAHTSSSASRGRTSSSPPPEGKCQHQQVNN